MKRTTARAADKIALSAVTLCLAANAYGIPSQAFWTSVRRDHPYLLILLLLLVGTFGAFAPFESWSTRSLVDRSVTMKQRILSAFGKMLEMADAVDPPLDTGDLALHIWQRKRTLRHPLSGVLARAASYRMSTYPLNRMFSPQRGVGVVGMCWEKNHDVAFDVSPLSAELTTEAAFTEYVAEHGSASVMNLDWPQFLSFRHRTAIFASPIRNGRNRFVGCISVDASRGFAVLNRRALKEEIANLALAVGREEFECT
jgi:hypothetical protein